MSIIGRIVLPQHVKNAVAATIRAYLETYLAEVERQEGLDPRTLPVPSEGAYLTRDDDRLEREPEDDGPTVIIMTPGTAATPAVDGDGAYRARWPVNIAVVAEARDQNSTSDLAGYYAGAVRALLVQQGSLMGFANGTTWKGERYGALPADASESIATAINVFEVDISDVVTRGGGPRDPLDEPYEETELPTVEDVDVVLKPEEIT